MPHLPRSHTKEAPELPCLPCGFGVGDPALQSDTPPPLKLPEKGKTESLTGHRFLSVSISLHAQLRSNGCQVACQKSQSTLQSFRQYDAWSVYMETFRLTLFLCAFCFQPDLFLVSCLRNHVLSRRPLSSHRKIYV